MRNLLIHAVDAVHHYVFRHFPPQLFGRWYLFCACDTLAMSDWWTCDHTDFYCRRFDWKLDND